VVAALELVPGVAPDAVVAVAHGADDRHAGVDLALVHEEPGDRVLGPRPALVRVGEGCTAGRRAAT
jgi:hypothetical protein